MQSARLPALVAVVAGLVLAFVVVGQLTAGADPAPRDTSPIRVGDLQPGPGASSGKDDDDDRVKSRIRDDDDDDGPDDDDIDHD